MNITGPYFSKMKHVTDTNYFNMQSEFILRNASSFCLDITPTPNARHLAPIFPAHLSKFFVQFEHCTSILNLQISVVLTPHSTLDCTSMQYKIIIINCTAKDIFS